MCIIVEGGNLSILQQQEENRIIHMSNKHLSRLAYNLYYRMVLKTYLMHCKFSFHVSLNMRMSYKYETTKEFVNSHRISSIILMNIFWSISQAKGHDQPLKRLSLYLNVVFHTLVCPTGT